MRRAVLALCTLLAFPCPAADTMLTSLEFSQKLKPFAKDGGGNVYAVAITAEQNRANYTFGHWAGFMSTEALRGTVTRPSPPYLLVCNHPYDRESNNQNVVEEIIRWEPDGTFVSTGVIYSKWGKSSSDFKAAAMALLSNKPVLMSPEEFFKKTQAFAMGGGGNRVITAVTRDSGRPGYPHSHWAGFFTTGSIGGTPVARPTPPLILVSNGPVNVESKNQSLVEELVRWEADGSFVSTGVIYSKGNPAVQGGDAFRTGAAKVLKAP